MAEKKTGLAMPAGILQPTMPPDDPPAGEGQGGATDDGPLKAASRAARRSTLAARAGSGKVEGRKFYLPEDLHFRLRMLAYSRGQKLSECAAEVLDKALPRWNVDRTG
jgi:hypothetical protein